MKRTDTEILKDLVDEVMEYNALRDEEWDFQDEHGHPDMWDGDECEEHEKLIDDILMSRKRVRDLLSEARGEEVAF